jgi:hypothetical protein
MAMITYADTVAAHGETDLQHDGQPRDQEPGYELILRTLQTCPLGQEDDTRRLMASVILGEN